MASKRKTKTIQVSGDLSVVGSVTAGLEGTFGLSVTGVLVGPTLQFNISVATAHSGKWSSFYSWQPNYLRAEGGIATISLLNSFIQGAEDPSDANLVNLTYNTTNQVVKDFEHGPTNSVATIQIGASIEVPVTPDIDASGSLELLIPVEVNFNPIINEGDSITVDQQDVQINNLMIDKDALLQTGDSLSGYAGLAVMGNLTNGGIFNIKSATSVSVAGSVWNEVSAAIEIKSLFQFSGSILNEGLIEAFGGSDADLMGSINDVRSGTIEALAGGVVTLAGPVKNYGDIDADSGLVNIYGTLTDERLLGAIAGGSLSVSGSIFGGTMLADTSSTIQLGAGAGGGGVFDDVTLGGDGTGEYVGGQTDDFNFEAPPYYIGGDELQNVVIQDGITFVSVLRNNTALGGVIRNSGLLVSQPEYIGPGDNFTPGGAFVVDGPVTLTGGGTLDINGELEPATNYVGDGFVLGLTPGSDLLTNVNNTIMGSGEIDANLSNQVAGVIDGQGLLITGSLDNHGTIEALAGGLVTLDGTLDNAGVIAANAGIVDIDGQVVGAGVVDIEDGATVRIGAAIASAQTMSFVGAGSLLLDDSADFHAGIFGFDGFSTIDINNFGFSESETVSFSENSLDTQGILSISNGMQFIDLKFLGSYVISDFSVTSDGHTGILVT